MATFALGLTKTAVAGTVNTVKSAIDEETKLRIRVQEDLVFITGEFEMMQSFLSASGARELASKNQVVRTWVRQLRDLAFDVENCVEFIVHLDKASRWDWVQRLVHRVASVLVCTVRPPLPLDEAVAEIKRLKARVDDVSQRNTRYNLFTSGDGGGHDDSDQQLLTQATIGSTSSVAAAAFHVLREVWKDTGKLYESVSTRDLKRLIDSEGSELQVISLWGSPQADVVGDLGWMAIVKKEYDDPDTCREFKNRAWIKPTHPFNPVEFLNTLLTHFRSHVHHHHNDDKAQLVQQISELKYLIVLEQELSSVAEWDAIRLCLLDGNQGSRIVVSTRHLGIALACTKEPFQAWELNRDQYLYAFSPKGRGRRIGMDDLLWQLRRPCVISVLYENSKDRNDMMDQLTSQGKKFEHFFHYWDKFVTRFHDKPGENEMKRKFVTEQDCLICVEDVSSRQWDSMKPILSPEHTRSRVVILTDKRSVARHCADHESRVLNAQDLLWRSDHEGQTAGKGDTYVFGNHVGHTRYGNEFSNSGAVIMAVWGIPGVGKSSFVRHEYYYSKKYHKDYTMYLWADVRHPFNLTDFCRRLCLDLVSEDAEAKEAAAIAMMEGRDLTHLCSEILHTQSYFLVIDGLQSKHDWDLIDTALSLSQSVTSRTIVITGAQSIAKHCSKEGGYMMNIKLLEDDLAHELFTKQIASEYEQLSPEAARIVDLIIPKCGGLPGIITAMGRECKGIGSVGIDLLKTFNDSFMPNLETIPCLRSLFCWMQSYFDTCSDELKPCIFYLSVFPPHQSIRRTRLLRRWIAEGYLRDTDGGLGSSEKVKKFFSELTELSILYGDKRTAKLNGFFREYITSRPMEDNLVFALEGHCTANSRLTGQHLTISNSWVREKAVFNNIDFSRLRSLSVFGAWESFLVSDNMKVLRVLDLEGTSTSDVTTGVTDAHLEEIAKQLHRLKFLSLRGCQQITRLPDSLGDMRELQTLDVRHTDIVELPPAIITKLHKLQYIRAGTTPTPPPTPTPTPPSTRTTTPPSTPPPTPPPPPPPPNERNHRSSSLLTGAIAAAIAVKEALTKTTGGCRKMAGDLVESCRRGSSWLQFKKQMDLHSRERVYANGGGVEVLGAAAKGIGRLTDMHTLGVVNIAGGKSALLFLEELKKLTQLRKLGLSGINRKNWRQLCDTISGNLHHLESLSLQLMLLEKEGGSYDFACFDNIAKPPNTLKRLKVMYTPTGGRAAGGACIRPVWLAKLPDLRWFQHDVTISTGEDMRVFFRSEGLPGVLSRRLRVKPNQDQQLCFDESGYYAPTICLDAVRICCGSSSSTVTFGNSIPVHTEELSIHCCSSCGSSSCLRIYGLQHIRDLKEVRVTGSCSQDLKEDLLKQLNDHPDKPVPKLLICDQ